MKAVIAALAIVGMGGWLIVPSSSRAAPAGADLVARGAYLVVLGDCAACHTAKDGPRFGGGLSMETPFGPIFTPNITPDKQTGIGNITDDQFYRVLHDGIGMKGEHLYPVMPFPWYTQVTRADALAIKAYLFSLEPIHRTNPANGMAFPFNQRAGLAVWDRLFLNKGPFRPDPSKSAEVNRGAYIVQGLGHCGECHNGRNLLGDTRLADQLQGGPIQSWYAPNITNDVASGIGKYTDDQLYSYLKHGVAAGMGIAAGPMAETVHDSLSHVTDPDIRAVIAYLRSAPGTATYQRATLSAFTGQHPLGETVYLNNCASCHQLNGKGIPGQVPSLAGNGAVLAKGPQDVIRAILGGMEARGSYAPMPAVGHALTDRQIADVANYVRQAWGNKAPPTASPGAVGTLRPATFTAMNMGPEGHCPAIGQPGVAAAVADPKSGIADALKAMTLDTVLQTAQTVVGKVRAAVPAAKRADVVNGLTAAYCPVVQQDDRVAAPLKVAMLDTFSERVYSVLGSNGKE
jgi:mono/diheme cytochrome c family protein